MSQARIVLQPPLASAADGTSGELLVEGDTVAAALRAVCKRHPRLLPKLFERDQLSPFVHVFVNGDQLDHELCAGREVRASDEIFVLTAIRGG